MDKTSHGSSNIVIDIKGPYEWSATVLYWSHAKNHTEISKFERDFRISRFCEIEISHHSDKRKIVITYLILKIQD